MTGWPRSRRNGVRWPLRGFFVLAIGVLGLVACAAPPPLPDVADVDLTPVWEAWWLDDLDDAIARADELGWEASGSIAGERVRQALRGSRGERPSLVRDLRQRRREQPEDPDLAYLEARLFQNSSRSLERFRELARAHPRHPWIQLGLASLMLGQGASPRTVRQRLAAAPERNDTAPFRRQIEARLLAREQKWRQAFDLLEADAFEGGNRDALLAWVEIAMAGGREREERRGRAEVGLLRTALDQPLGLRVAVVAERALAEARAFPELDLDAFLARLDAWSARLDLATGWRQHPRYSLGPVGELVRPERASGGPAAQWAEAGHLLLAGDALFHGLELLVLQGVERFAVDWPGETQPLEIAIARRGRSSRQNLATGGTLFHGFYVREDLLGDGLEGLERRAARVGASPPEVEIPQPVNDGDLASQPPPGVEPPLDHRLPEDWDLALRIHGRLLGAGGQALDFERELLLLHEAGHLPDVLRWLPDGPSFLGAVPAVLHSLLASGDPMTWLEFRAAARALAATPHPRWALADLVRTTHGGMPRYREAYTWLLRELLVLGESRGLPPFHRWDELEPAVLTDLALRLCQQQGLELLPPQVVEDLLAGPGAGRD